MQMLKTIIFLKIKNFYFYTVTVMGILRKNVLWPNHDELRVHFLNPEVLQSPGWASEGQSPLSVDQILEWASCWNRPNQKYPIISRNVTSKEDAHIRIQFHRKQKLKHTYMYF